MRNISSIEFMYCNLEYIRKEHVQTLDQMSMLVQKVRNVLDIPFHSIRRNKYYIGLYYDVFLYVVSNYNINPKHFSYIHGCNRINLNSDIKSFEVLSKKYECLKCIDEAQDTSFSYELNMRPLETIFGYEDNLLKAKKSSFNLNKYKNERIERQKLEGLKSLFWPFVEEANEILILDRKQTS